MLKTKFTLADQLFRQMLKELRAEQGFSQRELARRLRVPQSYISKFETGERRLDFAETVYVCEALGTTIERFAATFAERLSRTRRQKGQ